MKVMFIDYWTKGLHHFEPIDKALKEAGHTTMLFHLGSMRGPCAAEESIRGIACRDILFYNTRLIYKVLEQERPDVVLTLNARTVFDRAVVLACRTLGIRSVFLSHGIDTFADKPDAGSKIFEKTVNTFSFLLPRVGKYAYSILPNYFYSIWKSGSGPMGFVRGFRTIAKFALNPGRAVQIPPAIEEVTHDRHLMFSAHAVESLCKLGYPRSIVTAVGNPKYDDLLNRLHSERLSPWDLPEEVQALVRSGRPYALLLEDAFPEATGMGGWTAENRNQWLIEIAEGLKVQGYDLVVKLHPGTIRSSVDLGDTVSFVFQTADLNALIKFSAFCVAHNSTTVDNCVLLDKPVVAPAWGRSKGFCEFFIELGVSQAWHSPTDAPDLNVNQALRAQYKRERITVLEPIATATVVEHLTQRNMNL